MSEKDFEISRRKALAGIGVVGVASAGAGLGTTAYFSDQEEFDGNTIMAGEFGLTVEGGHADVDQDGIGPDEGGVTEEGGAFFEGTVDIEDAKPGDSYEFCWDITVENNPGYVVVGASDLSDLNGVQAENVALEDLWGIDDENDLSTLGQEATATAEVDGYEVYSNSLAGLVHDMEDGLLLETDGGSKWEGEACLDADETVEFCVYIDIPTGIEPSGNAIQGAVASADLVFYAEQCRHNDPESIELPNGD